MSKKKDYSPYSKEWMDKIIESYGTPTVLGKYPDYWAKEIDGDYYEEMKKWSYPSPEVRKGEITVTLKISVDGGRSYGDTVIISPGELGKTDVIGLAVERLHKRVSTAYVEGEKRGLDALAKLDKLADEITKKSKSTPALDGVTYD